jgi:O-antigen/teichoic acid export membrane protein
MSSTDAGRVGIGTHYLRYSTANILVMAAGLISFPVLTRLLDNTQYGILGYYETWVMMAVAVAKLGAQHAILRFYPFDGDGDAVEGVGSQPKKNTPGG